MKLDLDTVWLEATSAAQQAANTFQQNELFGGCGFAWIRITNGRSKFAKYAKEFLNAHKNYGGKGFNIWYSQVYNCKGSQNIYSHEYACQAAAKVLNNYGIECHVESRLD